MDSKTLTSTIANAIGADTSTTKAMLDAFADIVADSAKNLSSIAIPSFGTIATKKADEEIITDRVTGRNVLLPPQITVEFIPAAMLRKKVAESHE